MKLLTQMAGMPIGKRGNYADGIFSIVHRSNPIANLSFNWFEKPGHNSIADKIGENCNLSEGKVIIDALLAGFRKQRGVAGENAAMNQML